MKEWLKVTLGILIGATLVIIIQVISSPPRGKPVMLTPAAAGVVVVQVDGSVVNPGLFTFPEGSRVGEAITAAGGFLPEIEVEPVNLARPLKDGERIHIGQRADGKPDSSYDSGELNNPTGLINLNTATLADLDSLPGIGETRAAAILQYREEYGAFISVDELKKVPGISESIYDNLKDLVMVE